MATISYILNVFKFCGVWRPDKCQAGWKKKFYSVHSAFVVVAVCTFFLSQFVNLLHTMRGEIEEIANNTFMLITTICVACKIGSLLKHRRDIVNYIGMFDNETCTANGSAEIDKENEFDSKMRFWISCIQSLVGFTAVAVTASSFMSRILPFNAWIPFDRTTSIGFWCAYTHQNVAHALCASIGCTFDLFFCNLLNLACIQLNILKLRLRSMSTTIIEESRDRNSNYESVKDLETRVLAKSVWHHLRIFKFARLVNETFSAVVLVQCTVSTFVLCVSTYLITRMKPFSTEFMFLIAYINCMLSQIFLYCWHGNQLILESMDVSNALYAMDWPLLNIETQRKLVIIMARSFKPIRFTSGNIIVLSLETYTSLLKLSYSIYNFLSTSE